jgi:hypothetical protein
MNQMHFKLHNEENGVENVTQKKKKLDEDEN